MFIEVNGVQLFYEKQGKGPSIILLHGNMLTNKMFKGLVRLLIPHYTVYTIDSRDHGRSSRGKGLTYELMMEDVAAFITQLKLNKPIVYGYSDGGNIGMLLAACYPELLSKLIISSGNMNPQGLKQRWRELFKVMYLITRNSKINLMLEQPNIQVTQLKKIKVPVLILAGSRDIIKQEQTRCMAVHIPRSQLRILEGEGHMSYAFNGNKLYKLIVPFLKQ